MKVRADAVAFGGRQDVASAVTAFGARGAAEPAVADLQQGRCKVLENLGRHRTSLTVFVEHPEVPMGNNTVERSERGPLAGRKTDHGVVPLLDSKYVLLNAFRMLKAFGTEGDRDEGGVREPETGTPVEVDARVEAI